MLRERLSDRLKEAMKEKNPTVVSTVRLILTAVKDRDIAARGKGNAEGVDDQEILSVLQTMVRQREDAIALYEQGGRDFKALGNLRRRSAATENLVRRLG